MKILHLVRTDLRRFRLWWVAWLVLVALPMLLGVVVLRRDPLETNDWRVQDLHVSLLVLQGVVAYLLTLVVLQGDPLMGTRMFWLTRPISAGRLLAAKAAALGLIFGVFPLAMMLVWWTWCGLGAGDIMLAAVEWGAMATLVVLPAAVVAVLTDTLARSLLWSMVLAAAVPVMGLFFTEAVKQSLVGANSSGLVISRFVLGVAGCVVVFAVVVVLQFLLRRYGWWLFAAGAVVLVMLAAMGQWPWVIIGQDALREIRPELARGVEVQWRRARAERLAGRIDTGPGLDVMQRVDTEFIATGLPKGMWLSGVAARQHWQFGEAFQRTWRDELSGANGHAVTLNGMKGYDHWGDEETERMHAEARRRKNLPDPAPRQSDGVAELKTRAFFRPSLVARMRAEPPAYDARLWFNLRRMELEFEMPLAPGTWRVAEGRAVRIHSVVPEIIVGKPVRHWDVVLVETSPAPMSGMLLEQARRDSLFPAMREVDREDYVLINEARSEFDSVSRAGPAGEIVVNGVRIRWQSRGLALPTVIRNRKTVVAPGWTPKITLGRVTNREVALFRRDVTGRFELEP